MKEITLTRGQVTQVKDERYDFLNQRKWYASWNSDTKSFYAKRTERINGKKHTISMHNIILGISKGGDHIDGNTLNNQDDNLRPDPERRNSQNQKIRNTNKSGFKGVYWDKNAKKWRTQITFKSKIYHLGYFILKEDAARAYNKKALELHGEFARLNIFI